MRAWLTGPGRYRHVGVLLFALGLLFTVFLALRASIDDTPSLSTAVLLALISAVFQVGGAVAFRKDGRADDSLAVSSSERLYRLGLRAQAAADTTQKAFESNMPAKDLHTVLGIMSNELDNISDKIVDALRDWQTFHPAALRIDPDPPSAIQVNPSTPEPIGAEDDDH